MAFGPYEKKKSFHRVLLVFVFLCFSFSIQNNIFSTKTKNHYNIHEVEQIIINAINNSNK